MAQDEMMPPQNEQELVLRIANERPVQASELGELFSALARDYRQMNRGRVLAVASIETGSILIYLRDALLCAKPYIADGVELAKGAKALLDFAKSITDLITKKKSPQINVNKNGKRGPYRSIEAMMKLAAESGSELTVRYVAGAEELFEAKLTPVDAEKIRERERQVRRQLGQDRHAPSARTTDAAIQAIKLADELEQLALPSPSDSRLLVSTVVRLLRSSGNIYLIETLAMELEGRGLFELAAVVRAESSTDEGDHVSVVR